MREFQSRAKIPRSVTAAGLWLTSALLLASCQLWSEPAPLVPDTRLIDAGSTSDPRPALVSGTHVTIGGVMRPALSAARTFYIKPACEEIEGDPDWADCAVHLPPRIPREAWIGISAKLPTATKARVPRNRRDATAPVPADRPSPPVLRRRAKRRWCVCHEKRPSYCRSRVFRRSRRAPLWARRSNLPAPPPCKPGSASKRSPRPRNRRPPSSPWVYCGRARRIPPPSSTKPSTRPSRMRTDSGFPSKSRFPTPENSPTGSCSRPDPGMRAIPGPASRYGVTLRSCALKSRPENPSTCC